MNNKSICGTKFYVCSLAHVVFFLCRLAHERIDESRRLADSCLSDAVPNSEYLSIAVGAPCHMICPTASVIT